MISFKHDTLNAAGAVIGVLLVGVLAFLAWALVYVRVPSENETAMNVLLGILSTQVGIVVGFFFGSSVSTKKQTDTIDKLADTAKAVQAAASTAAPEPSIPLAPGDTVRVTAEQPSGGVP